MFDFILYSEYALLGSGRSFCGVCLGLVLFLPEWYGLRFSYNRVSPGPRFLRTLKIWLYPAS